MDMPSNPYGARPGAGISLSQDYRPTPSVTNRNYFPPNEPLDEGEMRISFPGSTPWPPTLSQSGTCIMVELGTGEFMPRRFFFDMGNGSIKNILGLGVLPMAINDIFLSHLHVDHYHDMIYMLPSRQRWVASFRFVCTDLLGLAQILALPTWWRRCARCSCGTSRTLSTFRSVTARRST